MKTKQNKILRCNPILLMAIGIILVAIGDRIEEIYLKIIFGTVIFIIVMSLLYLNENSLLKLERENKKMKESLENWRNLMKVEKHNILSNGKPNWETQTEMQKIK